jgi:hypothetical protein
MTPFWTPLQLERARALRWYRRLWAACSVDDQWRHECWVYQLRGMGLPEREVGRYVESALNRMRPWRFTDAALGSALRLALRDRGRRR